MQMATVEAETSALAALSPAVPTRTGLGRVARKAAPRKAAPPPPSAPESIRALALSEAAKIAVEAFCELQEELQILERADRTSPWIGVKEHEAKLAQDWAIKVATKNRDRAAAEDKPADGLRKTRLLDAESLLEQANSRRWRPHPNI
jgi:hypothetical protein